jgi:adenine-specific DNA-methyltransferase
VPYRPLVPDADRSIGKPRLDGNLIIHGDNLHALKALLPMYAGRVDCIFIDPPYNTGNEGWCYNDNVNSPMIREWLSSNPVGIEDGLRHDKWLAMMWPRLRLLRELLADDGSIWITLDDNEVHRARCLLDEVFGDANFVAQVEWEKRYTRSNNTNRFTSVVDRVLVYRRSELFESALTPRDAVADQRYSNPDQDPRGPWKAIPFLNPATCKQRPNLCYTIVNPNTGEMTTPGANDNAWRNERAVYERLLAEERFWWGTDGKKPVPDIKRFLSEVKQGMAPINLWHHQFAGNTDDAGSETASIFGFKAFDTPKPVSLVQRVIEHAAGPRTTILDSFAGSATTAHAVLATNAKDGGDRKFILVECEDYADTLTAERVRRVINGYAFEGTQREELHRERLTFTSLKKADKIVAQVESIKNLDGHRFDAIKAEVKDGELIVTGERQVAEKTEGLGGEFTYCTLGEAVEMDRLLTGEVLPAFEQLGALLFYTATNEVTTVASEPESVAGCDYLGESASAHVWLIYRPDLEFLKSRDAALTLSRAEAIVKARPGKRHLVFAPARFVSQRLLKDRELPVEFAPLPFALYRVDRS